MDLLGVPPIVSRSEYIDGLRGRKVAFQPLFELLKKNTPLVVVQAIAGISTHRQHAPNHIVAVNNDMLVGASENVRLASKSGQERIDLTFTGGM